jgi:predicted PurR-regulated permease PerM
MSEGDSRNPGGPRGSGPDDFTRRAIVASVIAVSIAALAMFLWYAVYVLLLLFAGVLLAILLRALSDLVADRTRLSHRWALAVVLTALLVLFVGFVWLTAPQFNQQFRELGEKLPNAAAELRDTLAKTRLGQLIVSQFPGGGSGTTQPATPAPPSGFGPGDMLRRATGFLTNVFDVIAAVVVVGFTALFLAFDPRLYVRGTLRLLPIGYRARGGEVLGAVGYTLKWWLVGQAVAMVVVGVTTWLGLLLLGVPLAFVLGVLAAVFNFIPNFGPLIAMVPACLLAMADSPQKALWVIALFLVIQNLEGNLLMPLIQRKAVSMPPAIAIISQILMTTLAGGVGLLLAVPLAAAVYVLVQMLYVEDALGDRIETPADAPDAHEAREGKEQGEDLT